MTYPEVVGSLGKERPFGKLAKASTSEIIVLARNYDTSVGDLFLIPSDRGGDRIYVFRTIEYSNFFSYEEEIELTLVSSLVREDAYEADDMQYNEFLKLTGVLLGYAEYQADGRWDFRAPRRLPAHRSDVYKIGFGSKAAVRIQEACVAEVLRTQLEEGVFIGALLAGEQALPDVKVQIPGEYFAHHIGIFGRTGTGKSNILMVLIDAIYRNNRRLLALDRPAWKDDDRLVSLFAIDPHDEFARWKPGSRGGITRIVQSMSAEERARLVGPFFYLSCRRKAAIEEDDELGGLGRRVMLHRKDITPKDVISIMEFSDVMSAAAEAVGDEHGEDWITAVLNGDVEPDERIVHKASLAGINRRLTFLAANRSNLIPSSTDYESSLVDIVLALEEGRVLDVDTTLMTEVEQFLLTTVVARTVFSMRKALKSSANLDDLLGNGRRPGEIDRHFPRQGSLLELLKKRLTQAGSPYCDPTGNLRSIDDLPAVNIIVEEAPSILNPARIRFGSVFRDIARQGRKFGIGLTVVSQQVTEIDSGILSQLNTEINMALGNEEERQASIRTASNDISAFRRELQVMGVGQAILSASYKKVPLPIQVPELK